MESICYRVVVKHKTMFSSGIGHSGAHCCKLRTTFGFSRTDNCNKIYSNGIAKVTFWQSFVKRTSWNACGNCRFSSIVFLSLHIVIQLRVLDTYYVCVLDKKMWPQKLSVEQRPIAYIELKLYTILKDNLHSHSNECYLALLIRCEMGSATYKLRNAS